MSRARWLASTLFVALAAGGGAWAAGFRVNTTASMPRGIWAVTAPAGAVHRGDVVTLCLPDTPRMRLGHERGYIGAGSCPDGMEPLVKPVAAVPGDTVTVKPGGCSVNGDRVPNTAQFAIDGAGRPLQGIPPGTYDVEPGQVWVLSGHSPMSWDSRYFGPVPKAAVLGRARPMWVFR